VRIVAWHGTLQSPDAWPTLREIREALAQIAYDHGPGLTLEHSLAEIRQRHARSEAVMKRAEAAGLPNQKLPRQNLMTPKQARQHATDTRQPADDTRQTSELTAQERASLEWVELCLSVDDPVESRLLEDVTVYAAFAGLTNEEQLLLGRRVLDRHRT
jgi:hypothetical protein